MSTEYSLESLAIEFRFMQLFAHIGHNRVAGCCFFEDHAYLGSLYETYEGVYDDLVERMIGLGESPDLWKISKAADEQLQGARAGTSSMDYLEKLLECEKEACEQIEDLAEEDGCTQATVNMLVQFADDSEKRQYKIQQRLSKLSENAGEALDRLAAEKQMETDEEE
jgi:DNA-binding ferritin-like protein